MQQRRNNKRSNNKRAKWLTFNLRGGLLSILALSIPLAWLAGFILHAQRQKIAVQRIRDFKGAVERQENVSFLATVCPPIMRKIAGDNALTNVVAVQIPGAYETPGKLIVQRGDIAVMLLPHLKK